MNDPSDKPCLWDGQQIRIMIVKASLQTDSCKSSRYFIRRYNASYSIPQKNKKGWRKIQELLREKWICYSIICKIFSLEIKFQGIIIEYSLLIRSDGDVVVTTFSNNHQSQNFTQTWFFSVYDKNISFVH